MPAMTPTGQLETIRTWQDGPVVVVELHRPETLNAFNVRMAQELHAVLGDIAGDKGVRAVVLTGSGRGFSSGFDLIDGGMPTSPSGRPDTRRTLLEVFNPLVLMLRELPQPVVAALNGVAAGIGLSYALACDIIVAARSATLLLAFVNVGLVPDGGATVLVPARAGIGRALELSLLGDPISAERALEWGLVNRVESDERLLDEALALAHRLADGPPGAQAAIKGLLNNTFLEQLRTQLRIEAEVQGTRSSSDESADAIQAFAQRRESSRSSRSAQE